MALDLQLSTETAQKALDAFIAKVGAAKKSLDTFGSSDEQIQKVNKAIQSVAPLKPEVATSLTALTRAINTLGNPKKLEALHAGMAAIAQVDFAKAAASVQTFATAINSIKPPRGLAKLGENFAKIGNEARMGAAGAEQMAAAINKIRPPPKPGNLGGPWSKGVGGVNAFSSAVRTASGVLAAFGVQSAAMEIVDFGKASLDAATDLTQLQIRLEATGYSTQEQTQLMEGMNKVVDKFAIPLGVATKSFGKLAQGMASAGYSAETTMAVFEGFSTAFRAFGLTSVQIDRGFNAIDQVFKKGSVSMEELRQQLGEVFPAFSELATSMGVSTEALMDMMKNGEVASGVFIKLAADIREKFAVQAEKAGNTGQAAMIRFGTAIERIQQVVGKEMFNSFTAGLKALTAELDITKPSVQALAKDIGQTLGSAMMGAINVVKFLAENLSTLKVILAGLVIYKVGGVFLGMAQGMYQAGMRAVELYRAFVLLQVGAKLVSAWQAIPGILAAIRAGFAGAALATGLFLVQIAAAAIAGVAALYAFLTIGIAINSLRDAFNNNTNVMDNFTSGMSTLNGNLVRGATDFMQAAKSALGFGDDLSTTGEDAVKAAGGLTEVSDKAGEAGTGLNEVAEPAAKAATAVGDLKEQADPAATSLGTLATNTGNAATTSDALAQNLSSAAAQARSAARDYNAAAIAAGKLAAAQARVKGGGGGGGGGSADGFKGGGIAGQGGTPTSVTADAFRSAPRFAGGTANTNGYPTDVSGGGIAAVLHPNEAVVPLAGGGSIPISVDGGMGMGGGAPSGASGLMADLMLDQLLTLRDMNTNIDRVIEAIDVLTILTSNEFGKLHTAIMLMSNNIVTMIGTLANGFASIRNSGGGGGGGGSSGGGFGGGSGGSDDEFLNDFKAAKRQKTMNNVNYKSPVQGTGIGYFGSDGRMYSSYEKSPDYENNKQIEAQNANISQELIDKYGLEKIQAYINSTVDGKTRDAINRSMEWSKSMGISTDRLYGFASGSPNAFQDTMSGGGFMATLHPNEAVIPLKDGRTVPVELPRSFMDKTSQGQGNINGLSNPGRPAINVTMNITTPDANSFRASKQQILQELRGELERSARNVGPSRSPTIEDPTKRVS